MAWLHAVIDVPGDERPASARFWAETLGWPVGPPWQRHPELRSFEPPDGRAYVHLQAIDGSPRLHLDLESADPDETASTAVATGAVPVARRADWQTFHSPGGLPFCVVRERRHTAPGPVRWPDGHRTRLVQVCVDAPAARHDAEVAFWRGLLGGRWVDSPAAEFAGKWHDDAGSPLQLLFQRLDEPEGAVRAHLDLGTDDQDAEVARVIGLGARDHGPGPGGWHVLEDPSGLLFCVTENPPDQTEHRDLG